MVTAGCHGYNRVSWSNVQKILTITINHGVSISTSNLTFYLKEFGTTAAGFPKRTSHNRPLKSC